MGLVTKENAKVGSEVFVCIDERPFGDHAYYKAVITEVCEDHYLYKNMGLDIENVWGFYGDSGTLAVYTSEKEAKQWLRK